LIGSTSLSLSLCVCLSQTLEAAVIRMTDIKTSGDFKPCHNDDAKNGGYWCKYGKGGVDAACGRKVDHSSHVAGRNRQGVVPLLVTD
jgi:hypothetical protein